MRPEIRYTTFSGIELKVEPLGLAALRSIKELAKKEIPEIDKTPYLKPIPNAASEDMVYLDEENPIYRKQMLEYQSKIGEFITAKTLELCVQLVPGQDLSEYEQDIDHHRQVLSLNGSHDNVNILIHHIALARVEDLQHVMGICKDNYPLSEDEVSTQANVFRANIPGKELPRAKRKPPGVKKWKSKK